MNTKYIFLLLFLAAKCMLLLPVTGVAQCPQYVNHPLRNAQIFMSLAEQRLDIRFTDSSITANRDRLIYNTEKGDFVVKLTAREDTVLTLYFEAPNAYMKTFSDWFGLAFGDCATETAENKMVFDDCVLLISPLGERRKVFYLAGR